MSSFTFPRPSEEFSWLFLILLLVALSAGGALLAYRLSHPQEHILKVRYNEKEKRMVIEGNLPQDISIFTTLDTLDKNQHKTTVFSQVTEIKKNGVLSLQIPMIKQPQRSLVTVVWAEKGEQKGLARILEK